MSGGHAHAEYQDTGPDTAPPSVARALERWLAEHAYASCDPYDALTSPLLRPTMRIPLLARTCMQIVKRSPVDLRPLLGIRPAVYTKSLSDLASAYFLRTRMGEPGAAARARSFLDRLRDRRLPAVAGSAWGMDLPYVSRFVAATPETPNLFQSVNAANAFVDAWDLEQRPADLEIALGFVEFLETGLGRLEESHERIAWRYYPGQDACVYNVNALVGALLLRLARATRRNDLDDLGRRTLRFVAAEQNVDGSWPYARGPRGRWVDGFHTGYVLEAFLAAEQAGVSDFVAARERGVRFYVECLFTPEGLPRYTAESTHPIEVQNCAQAIQTLAKLAACDGAYLKRAHTTASAVIRALFRWTRREPEPAGYFILARAGSIPNRLPAVRWGQAPMLLALAHLEAAARSVTPEAGSRPIPS